MAACAAWTALSPRSMYPASRVSRSSAVPLFSPPDYAGARLAPPPRPRPCGVRVGAGARLDRRSGCHGQRRNNPAPHLVLLPRLGPEGNGSPRLGPRGTRARRGRAGRPTPPVRSPASPERSAASAPWCGCRLPRPAWRHPAGSDSHNSSVVPLETPPRSRARTRLVYPTSRAAPVCRTARPTRVLGPAAAGPRSSHWTAGARQTRPVCAPVRARRRAFHALSPVGAHRWPASPPPHPHRRQPTGLEPGGGPPASVGSGECTSRSRQRRGESGTCPLVQHGSARPTSGEQSGAGPANTPRPSPTPTTAWRSRSRLLDCQGDACELRVCWPAIWHEDPLLVQDMVGNQHTIDRPICVLAFYRIIVKKWCTSNTYVSSPSSTRLTPWAITHRLGSYMELVGWVVASRRESNKPGIAVTSRSLLSVQWAMLVPNAAST